MLVFALLLASCLSSMPRRLDFKELKKFYSQFGDSGAKVVKFQDFGLGIQVNRNFSEGAVVMCLDKSDKLNPMMRYELSEYVSMLPELTQLKIKVLYYKFMGPLNDFFTDYVDSLPLEYFHIGTWSRKQLNYFDLVRVHDLEKEDLYGVEELKQIKIALGRVRKIPKEMFEYESYMWASYTVTSRFFNYDFSDGTFPVMIPFLDIPNHYPNPPKYRNNGFFLKNSEDDCLRTYWNLSPGDQFHFDYATHDSLTFLLDYGMVINKNPKDFFYLEFTESLPEDIQEGWFKCFADSINLDLLRSLTFNYEEEVYIERFRQDWEDLEDYQQNIVFFSLIEYRNLVFDLIEGWGLGLRQVRRTLEDHKDYVYEMINKYAIVSRETYYFHVIAVEKEILFAFYNKLMKED